MTQLIRFNLHFRAAAILAFLLLFAGATIAQEVSGTITDSDSGEPLFGASVVITGTATGATTDFDGKFKFNAGQKPPFQLTVSYIGYQKQEIDVTSLGTPIEIKLATDAVMLEGVVVKDVRVSEKQKESALTVESMDVIAIKETPAVSFYDGLGNLKGVDLTAASIGFKVINTRGFNSTSPVRSLQVIDGVDNQSPGLNFSLGNFLGSSELDVLKVDIIQGASSAFYGPNAFNGVIDMKTKSPFIKPGLEAQVKIGERNLGEAAVRWAQVFKNKDGEDKFAYKLNLYYLQAYDWVADNKQPIYDLGVPASNPGGYDAVNRYGDEDLAGGNDYRNQQANYPGLGIFYRRGYMEKDLVDYNVRNFKANLATHYRIKPDLELIYSFNFGTGTTVYQGQNRFSLKDMLFFQNRVEIAKKDKWFVRAYSTNEDAGKSYDAVVTAFKMLNTQRTLEDYNTAYANYWVSKVRPQVRQLLADNGVTFGGPGVGWNTQAIDSVLALHPDQVTAWHQQTTNALANDPLQGYPAPGSDQYNQLFNSIRSTTYTSNKIAGGGSRFFDKSALYHLHGEYKLDPEINGTKLGKFTFGANGRLYAPNSRGTIFDEMRIAKGSVTVMDTIAGQPVSRDSAVYDTTFRKIFNWEVGMYFGWERKFLNDKLKATVAARVDKNVNFPFLVSPAASLVYMPTKDHTIRFGFSAAIRNPTLADQYLYYDVGRAILVGNLHGFNNLIDVDSFTDFLNSGLDTNKLKYFNVAPIKPEKVRTLEAGYRGFFFQRLYVDASYYLSFYQDFIGYELGIDAQFAQDPNSPPYPTSVQAYRVSANSQNQVITQGASIGLNYYFQNKYTINGNYSWNKLQKTNADDPIIPAFNTPQHKFNLGFSARDLGKAKMGHFGFSLNYKWIQGFIFEGSPQFTGYVPTYDMFDAQVSYRIPNDHITFKLGASNIFGIQPFFRDGTTSERFKNAFNNLNAQVYGGPRVGRMAYFSILFEWN
ncbi:MAG: TonB-dependent receptor plug domain-containing protein [Flavobacteriales bacterium]|nr:TonB-dependent receptor plug domain-containing protein [Flavobacteriales bacterium]